MQTKVSRFVRSRVPWVLTVVLALGAPAPVAAAASHTDRPGRAALGWGSYQPKGWSAGSVRRGTGYWRPGASLRVRDVQRRLDRLGYRTGPVDGFFGPITDGAVRHYQGDHALIADGVVGPRTLKDLRSRTRRAQGSVDRQTSSGARQPGARKSEPATSSDTAPAPDYPAWWQVILIGAAAFALAVLAAVLTVRVAELLRTAVLRIRRGPRPDAASAAAEAELYGNLYVEGRSRDERIGNFRGFAYAMHPVNGDSDDVAERPSLLVYDTSKPKPVSVELSEITAINGRKVRVPAPPPEVGEVAPVQRRSEPPPASTPKPAARSRPRMSRVDESLSSRRSARERCELQIVRRIEGARATRSRQETSPKVNGDRPDERTSARPAVAFRWLGARVHLADGDASLDSLPVEVELFVESEHSRWETGLVDGGGPFAVPVAELETAIEALVVPQWLPALAGALGTVGVSLSAEELIQLPFVVERTIEVERAIAGREVSGIPIG
jgi:hypothetical protein